MNLDTRVMSTSDDKIINAGNSNSTYTWPQNSEFTIEKIPSPASWGNLVSPDKSLPEFSWSVIVMISFLIMVVVLPLANRFGRFKI